MSEERELEAWCAQRAAASVPDGFVERVMHALPPRRVPLLERSRILQAAVWVLAIGVVLLRTGATLLPLLAR